MNTVLDLSQCHLCPHHCGVNRERGELGFCRLDAGLHIANISLHKGEEPIEGSENGVCNVFFSHCNLRCVYCQNYQISQPQSIINQEITNYEVAIKNIVEILSHDVHFLGFVSPTSHIPQMLRIIEGVHQRGFFPKIIYNTNGYENASVLQNIENVIDIYLPDVKYASDELGKKLSGIASYRTVIEQAIKEMYRQKKGRITDKNPSLIVRHLVLPNAVQNSLDVLELLAQWCSTDIFVSLMSQYFPVHKALQINELNRTLTHEEYDAVLDKLDELGFENGWTQLLESNDFYQPDFTKEKPFES